MNPTDASKRAREIAEKEIAKSFFCCTCNDCADRLVSKFTTLLERIDELEGALKPFVEAATKLDVHGCYRFQVVGYFEHEISPFIFS